MAPQPNHQPARRTHSRIVPAIPHRFSRPVPVQKPSTPDESRNGTAKQEHDSQEPAIDRQSDILPAQPLARVDGVPLTPDSGSAANKNERQTQTISLASSPTKSVHEDVQHDDNNTVRKEADPVNNEPRFSADVVTDTHSNHLANGTGRKHALPNELPPPFYPANKPEDRGVHNETPGYVPHLSHHQNQGTDMPASGRDKYGVPDDQLNYPQNGTVQPLPTTSQDGHIPVFIPLSQQSGQPQNQIETSETWLYPSVPIAPISAPHSATLHRRQSRNTNVASHANGHKSSNGVRTPHSRSPVNTQSAEPRPTSEPSDEVLAVTHQNQIVFPNESLEESPFELASYLSRQFGKPDFTDHILQIRSSTSILLSIPVHGIIVVRSPVIADAVSRSALNSRHSHDGRRLIDVPTADTFVTGDSVEEAIRVIYGAPLLSAQTFLYGIMPYAYDAVQSGHGEVARRMRQLLNYVAAGSLLQIPSMQHRGVEIARMLLRWDTVHQVLHFALRPNAGGHTHKQDHDFEDPFCSTLIGYAIEFIAFSFPQDFKFFSIAPELHETPRLPLMLDTRPSSHNPRLSKIRFGDAPPEDDQHVTSEIRLLSSILLSLPFVLVDRIFNHPATAGRIGWPKAVAIMQAVVNEREHRRKKGLAGMAKSGQSGMPGSRLTQNLYIEERLEQVEVSSTHPSGYRISTAWVGEQSRGL